MSWRREYSAAPQLRAWKEEYFAPQRGETRLWRRQGVPLAAQGPLLCLHLMSISAVRQANCKQLKLRSLYIKQVHKEQRYVHEIKTSNFVIDDKSQFKGRPFLSEKGAAKAKRKISSSPFLQLQQNLSVKFCKTQPYLCIFGTVYGKNFRISKWCMSHWEYIQAPRCGERYSTEPGPLTTVSTKKCKNLSFQVKNTCMTI